MPDEVVQNSVPAVTVAAPVPVPVEGGSATGGEQQLEGVSSPPEAAAPTTAEGGNVTAQGGNTTAPAPQRREWYHDRIGQLTARNKELEARLNTAPAPAATEQPGAAAAALTRDEINRRAVQLASEMKFAEECNAVVSQGKAEFNDFDASLSNLRNVIGIPTAQGPVLPVALVEAALATGQGHKVLYELSKDPDKAYEIASLSPARQAVALAQFAATATAPKVKVSNAPSPVQAKVGGGRVAGEARLDDDNLPIGEWMKLRDKQEREALSR